MSDSSPVEILIVEDNPYDLEMTLRGFTSARMLNHIHVARDGEEALDFLFRRGSQATRPAGPLPRLILLDLKLPKVDGLEVLAAIRGHDSTRTVPVVMMTSSQEQSDLVRSYELGVNSYIVKPVQFEGFVRAVQEIGMYWMLLNQPPAVAG
ncbi:MAG: response regulator [Rubrivivax sp.]|nr:response regulator [Rubrivivax sp.]